MKRNTTKSMMAVAILIIIFCVLNALHAAVLGIAGIISPDEHGIVLMEEVKAVQISMIIGIVIGGVTFCGLMTTFIIKSIKAVRNGVLFPACNVRILYFSALALFVYRFCYGNTHILNGTDRNITLNIDDLVMPMIMVLFAMIYKIAVTVSEENSLTI